MLLDKDFKGEIKGFPQIIVLAMLRQQKLQRNPFDVKVFEKRKSADVHVGGFRFNVAEGGFELWNQSINNGRFKYFFENIVLLRDKKGLY